MKTIKKLLTIVMCTALVILLPKINADAANENYKIVGFTVKRCETGTQTPIESDCFTVLFKGRNIADSKLVIPEKVIKTKIEENKEWLSDMENGLPYYLKIDTCRVLRPEASVQSGSGRRAL